MGIVKLMENLETKNDKPNKTCKIVDCGEYFGNDFENEKSDDGFPDFVEDSDVKSSTDRLEAAEKIKKVGNEYFSKKDYESALKKYVKSRRYDNFVK
jgi:peptidyl-prolyl isomerase D